MALVSCEPLRFLTAGSVDDGKSTLIGRLLLESGGVYEDEVAAVAQSTRAKNCGTIDFSLVTDGLRAEREQGITIDVAYRYFSTNRRRFIIADTPGHEQYTRNMVTAASRAEVAVLLIDAHKGFLSQTRRHAYIASLLGIRTVVIALNKMDLMDFDSAPFERTKADFLEFAAPLHFHDIRFVPMSALAGDNVVTRSSRMPWYRGPSFLNLMESLEVNHDESRAPFRLPVQTVIRAADEFRGYAGQIASGEIQPHREVLVLPSERRATIARIINGTNILDRAFAPMSVVVFLGGHTGLGRGDMLCDPGQPPAQTNRFRATMIWMSSIPMRLGEPYLIRHTTQTACMSIYRLLHKVDIDTLEPRPAVALQQNEIGEAEIETHKPIFCDAYNINRTTGSFVVIHPIHNATLACGTILEAHGRSTSGHESSMNGAAVARGLTVWMTGLSGAGKTTIAEAVCTELLARGISVESLDGDVVREHLSRDLGFSQAERVENVRRIGFVAQLLTRNGVVVLVSAISPYRAVRDEMRVRIKRFIEIFVNAPLEVCERRDPKGFYRKARAGQLAGFTGIDDPYEPPLRPEIECKTDIETIRESVNKIVSAILRAI